MGHNGVVVNTLESQFSSPISFPGRGEYELPLDIDIV